MRPKPITVWFLSFLFPYTSLSVSGQSQGAKAGDIGSYPTEIFHVGGNVTPPVPIYKPDPEFSKIARKASYQGTCVLSLIVGTDGSPRDIRVTHRLGMGFDEQAIRAVSQWKFEPGLKDGEPVAVAVEVDVSFHLYRKGDSKPIPADWYEHQREVRLRMLNQIYRIPGSEEPLMCPAWSTERQQRAITVADVIFEGDLRMPSVDRDRIAASIKQSNYAGGLDAVATEISESVQRAWQNSGYFTARVHTDASLLTSGPNSQRIIATVHIDEGQQYRLEGIQFRNNRAISDIAHLRALFPMKDGDVFSRDAIEKGMRDLHRVYGEYGYASLSAVPTTRVHEDRRTISLDIDLHEGKQFYISRVDVGGLDEVAFEGLRSEMLLKPGDIYNQRLMELFLTRLSQLPAYASFEPRYELQIDESAGTLALTYDFRPCQHD